MLKKRIIPCLDIKNGRTVKGVHFQNIRDAGDPVLLAQKYSEDGADELVFLDISATLEERKTLLPLVREVAQTISIPFTVGGGITSVDDVAKLLEAGADKISMNSAAVKRPELITEVATQFGNQCVVVAIDGKWTETENKVFVSGGKKETTWNTVAWAKKAVELGAGELLLTSMNQDGTKEGFDLRLMHAVSAEVSVPIIASGGAGSGADFARLFLETPVTGGLAASIFHFGKLSIPALKQELKTQNIPIR